jgi:phytoene dehydrogenase-like protein
MPEPDSDVVIIGGGHNGLVAANYLAKAGHSVTVLERRGIVGGACVTESFFPDYPDAKFSSCAFIQAVLRPQIIDDLELVTKHGLSMYAPDPQGFALFPDGSHLMLWQDVDKTLRQLEKRNPEDAKNFLRFGQRLRRFGEITQGWLLTEPPSRAELIARFEELGEEDLLNEFLFGSTRDLLNTYFTSPEVRGFMTFFGIVSIWGGPSTPGTAYLFGYHASGEFEGVFGRWAFPRGGMGAITQAMRRAAEANGVTVLTDAEVARIDIARGRANGVTLTDGSRFSAKIVMSNADPHRTFTKLVEPGALDPAFRRAAERIDTRGSMARLHLLVDELPHYVGFPDSAPGPQHRGHAILGGSEEAFEDAYAAMLRGVFPEKFPIEAIIPSVTDDSLAPKGLHTIVLGVQNLPFHLAEGDWDSRKEEFQTRVLECLFAFAPNLRRAQKACHTITPLDLERTYGITGGNIFHVAMTVSHMFGARPLPEAAGYVTPVKGLYLCSAGTHPGGGVIGAPGHNAAQVAIAELQGRAPDRASRTGKARGLIDRVTENEAGLGIAYQFARSRMLRSLTRIGTKTKGQK